MRRGAIALGFAAAAAAASFPQTVEVDLIFPRNETYAPADVFPIVFAFQNPALATTLEPSIDLQLWQGPDYNTSVILPLIDLSAVNFTNATGSGPVYVYSYALNLNTTGGGADAATHYDLVWGLGAGNCSAGLYSTEAASYSGGTRSKNVVFTLAKAGSADAAAPAINATDAASLCSGFPYFAFNLTGTLTVPDPTKFSGYGTCAQLADALPAGSPCAAVADAAAAASIMAAATSSACAAASPVISCPAASAGTDLLSARPALLCAASAWAALVLFSF